MSRSSLGQFLAWLIDDSNELEKMFEELLRKLFGLARKQIERTQPEEGSAAPNRVSVNPRFTVSKLTKFRSLPPAEG